MHINKFKESDEFADTLVKRLKMSKSTINLRSIYINY